MATAQGGVNRVWRATLESQVVAERRKWRILILIIQSEAGEK